MGKAVKGIHRGTRGKWPRAKMALESPLDTAKPHEVVWQQVAPIFDVARGIPNVNFVYAISEGEDGPVKIGRAKDPIKRVRTMQTGNPRRLRVEFVLIGEKIGEGLLHEMWEPFAIRSVAKRNRERTSPGTEWFRAECRENLFFILKDAIRRQEEYLTTFGQKSFDRCAEIIYEAHLASGIAIHERDESRQLAAGGIGYVVQHPSLVKYFANPPEDSYTWEREAS